MLRQFLVVFLLVNISACELLKGKGGQEDLSYKKDAISVAISATPDLNFYNNQSHAVTAVIYELSEPNIYNQMLDSQEGIVKLLEGGAFDASALSRSKINIQPGEFREVILDRVEKARYVAVVVGFYSIGNAKKISRLYPIVLKKRWKYFWIKEKEGPQMFLNIRLGRDSFIDLPKAKKSKFKLNLPQQ